MSSFFLTILCFLEWVQRIFTVDRKYIVLAALNGLASEGSIDVSVVKEAVSKFNIEPVRPAPWIM